MNKLKALACVAVALTFGTAIFAGCGNGEEQEPACEHTNLEKVDGNKATCYEEGNYAYYKCECGELFSDKNGQKPTTLEDVTIAKTRHDMHFYEEQVAGYNGYYFCNFCGRYYEDENGAAQIPYENFTDSSVAPAALPNGWTDPRGIDALTRNFTIRCFVGWTNSEGKSFLEFPAEDKTVWINVNLNRKITLSNKGWYNFGIAYNKKDGLQYKNFEAGHLTKVKQEFTDLFIKQSGIWVRIVRDGTNCSFYFEDKFGIPILISSNANFGADEALYRFAYGEASSVTGWVRSPEKAEVCWNVANPRCVFSNT